MNIIGMIGTAANSRWRWLLIVVLGTMLGTAGSMAVNMADLIHRLPEPIGVVVTVLASVLLQFIAIGIVAGIWFYLTRRRARGLLRRLVTREQFAEYRRTGHITEPIGDDWTAVVYTTGIAWLHPSVTSRTVRIGGEQLTGLWECIAPEGRLCPEDCIIAELLHARQAEFPQLLTQRGYIINRRGYATAGGVVLR